jgi:A/G-specific adenine glycosylase
LLPVKEKKQVIRRRWFYFLVCEWNGRFAVRKRGAGDIWENLFEFPSLEAGEGLSGRRLASAVRKSGLLTKNPAFTADGNFEQQLTHQKIRGHFFIVSLDQKELLQGDWSWLAADKIHKLAFPRILREYIRQSRRISG